MQIIKLMPVWHSRLGVHISFPPLPVWYEKHARNMANSYLRYHLSRPYPFQWFTPVALISLAIFATIFSLLNFAANGYVLAWVICEVQPSTLLILQ